VGRFTSINIDRKIYNRLHLIPADKTLWTEDKFQDFTKSRANLILNCSVTQVK